MNTVTINNKILLSVLALLMSLTLFTPSLAMMKDPGAEPYRTSHYSSNTKTRYKGAGFVGTTPGNNNPVTSKSLLINPYTITALSFLSATAYYAYHYWPFNDRGPASEVEADQKHMWEMYKYFEEIYPKREGFDDLKDKDSTSSDINDWKKEAEEANNVFKESKGEIRKKEHEEKIKNALDKENERIDDLYAQHFETEIGGFEDDLLDNDDSFKHIIFPPSKPEGNLDSQLDEYIKRAVKNNGEEGSGSGKVNKGNRGERENANVDGGDGNVRSKELDAQLLYNTGLIFHHSQNYQNALNIFNVIYYYQEHYETWLQNSANKGRLYYCRGVALYKLENYQEALDSFNEIYNNQDQYQPWLQNPITARKLNHFRRRTLLRLKQNQKRGQTPVFSRL